MGDPTESYVEYGADDMLPCAARSLSLSWLCCAQHAQIYDEQADRYGGLFG